MEKKEVAVVAPAVVAESDFVRIMKDLIAGTVGGIALVLVGHPFDTLKVRLQTQSTTNPMYNGMVDCAKKTVAGEGLGGLYKGVLSPLLGQMVFNAVQFVAYGQVKLLLGAQERQLSISESFIAGAATGFAVSFVESPIDLVKSQLQVQVMKTPKGATPLFNSVFGCAAYIARTTGFRGMFQGLGATIARDIPAVSLYFGFYEWTRLFFTPPGSRVEDLPAIKVLLAGGMGGFAYWTITYPIDLVKSTIQTDAIKHEERRFKGIVDATKQLYAEGGIPRFFRGFTPCLLRAFPGNAACFFAYEKTRQLLNQAG